MTSAWLLLLPVAALSGFFSKRKSPKPRNKRSRIPREYVIGLNYLLQEQPDKAVDLFVRLLEVDADTVETHLALGRLFRRQGELERAIRIHQNLVARPNLETTQRVQALLALGEDYMSAGVLDRAEHLLQEIADMDEYSEQSLWHLLSIYQQQKNWSMAIHTAELFQPTEKVLVPLSHYHCEVGEIARQQNQSDIARQSFKRALLLDENCVRATWQLARLESSLGHDKAAIRYYRRVQDQDPDFLPEILPELAACCDRLGEPAELMSFLWDVLDESPRASAILMLATRLKVWQGEQLARAFLIEHLQQRPSLRGINYLIAWQLEQSPESSELVALHALSARLLAVKPIYRCEHCGVVGKVLHWFCPSCKTWGQIKPIHGVDGE